MRQLLLLPVFVFFFLPLPGQHVIQVRDANSADILHGATIRCGEFADVLAGDFMQLQENAACSVNFQGYEPATFLPGKNGIDTTIIYLKPSTRVLSAVTVRGYQDKEKLTDIAGGYGYLTGRELEVFSDISPLPAFNSLPGIRMEQRSPGSYRFNIRGSTLRSPFGVRNVKVYLNNIPFTEPTGSTPFNMLDMEAVTSVDIIRGPAGSTYGAGIGGVIMLNNSLDGTEGSQVSGKISGGSFGMLNGTIHAETRSRNHGVGLTGSLLKNNGYRDHSAIDRKNLSLTGNLKTGKASRLGYQVFYTDLNYELPGGLTAAQRDEDPTAAREIAVMQDSRIIQNYFIGGLSYEYAPADENLLISAYVSSSNKENPFITNYEYEDLSGGGIRAAYQKILHGKQSTWRLMAGGEWQFGGQEAENFGNSGGFPDSLRFADKNRQFTGFEYFQASVTLENWHITAGASINHLNYNFDRLMDVSLDSAYTVDRRFDPVVSPRLAVVRNFGWWSVHGSYSAGFSPPTLDEVRTSDGGINEELLAERGHNLEFGVRGNFIGERLLLDLNLFQLWQQNTIVSQVDFGGVSTFQNSGSTGQRGLELMAGYSLVDKQTGIFRSVYLRSSLTLNHFRFTSYVKSAGSENADYSGNKLTGAPGIMESLSVNAGLAGGWNIEIRYLYTGEIPLNDANTVYSRAYHLLQARASWTKNFPGLFSLRLFAGGDNLLNQEYSLGNDLNAFGNRYFNPAASVTAYGGVAFSIYGD